MTHSNDNINTQAQDDMRDFLVAIDTVNQMGSAAVCSGNQVLVEATQEAARQTAQGKRSGGRA